MSPEQAKGRPADKYCDMWAFGAVLYEMLTGRRDQSKRAVCLTTVLLRGSAAAAGIAFVNALSSVGGVVGPWLVGWLKDAIGGIAASFVALAALGIIGSAPSVMLWQQTESRHFPRGSN
jgi:cyanate permease